MLTVVHDAESSNEDAGAGRSLLDEIVRDGARQMLAAALRAEVAAYIDAHAGAVDENGHRLVVRNGYHREREVLTRNCQYLWIGVFQATSVPVLSSPFEGGVGGVMSVGRSSSLPLWKTAPARTRATRCGALTARQRACAASISL